jgi:hypothetical protein
MLATLVYITTFPIILGIAVGFIITDLLTKNEPMNSLEYYFMVDVLKRVLKN